jgi:hypothetical protein
MKLFKSLFGIKKTDELVASAIKEKTYNVGYEIHCIDGSIKRNMCMNVLYSKLDETIKITQAEIRNMMIELEKAAKKNQTFVEIESNIYRVADVKSITFIQLSNDQSK